MDNLTEPNPGTGHPGCPYGARHGALGWNWTGRDDARQVRVLCVDQSRAWIVNALRKILFDDGWALGSKEAARHHTGLQIFRAGQEARCPVSKGE